VLPTNVIAGIHACSPPRSAAVAAATRPPGTPAKSDSGISTSVMSAYSGMTRAKRAQKKRTRDTRPSASGSE
jgi:hypothetical protein